MVTKLEGLSVIGIIAVVITFIQVGDLDLEPTHACLIKEIKAYCYSLSDSGVTCYTQPEKTGGKQCRGGQWELIPEVPEPEFKVTTTPNRNRIHCTSKNCT